MKTRSCVQLVALVLALISMVGLVGCSTSAVTIGTYISLAIDAGAKIATVLGVMTPEIKTYVTQGETWLANTTTELATTDTNAVKALKIAKDFATIAQPDLSGAGVVAQGVCIAFSIALSAVLAAVQAHASSQPTALMAKRNSAKDVTVTMPTPEELQALKKLHERALGVVAKVAKGKK